MVWYLDPADESVISSLIHTNPILTLKFRNMAGVFWFLFPVLPREQKALAGKVHTRRLD